MKRRSGSDHPQFKHGEKTPEYQAWKLMRARCRNPKRPDFRFYGGRGISVCKEWDEDYLAFLRDVGRRPSKDHSLDRIRNAEGYKPGNVQWSTRKEQARNTRRNVLITYQDETLCVSEWAERLGKAPQTLFSRLRIGWTDDEVIEGKRKHA